MTVEKITVAGYGKNTNFLFVRIPVKIGFGNAMEYFNLCGLL